jgi:fatty acid desaturase
VSNEALPPLARALRHLQPRDRTGTTTSLAAIAVTVAAIALSTSGSLVAWAAGQLLLAAAMVQWFVLLHECGHGTLFRGRAGNVIVGHIAGVMSAIPFDMWIYVHRQHHRWTGWQDLDPTTAALAPGRPRGAVQSAIVAFCWRFWIPLFSIVYRTGNFWNPVRLRRVSGRAQRTRAIAGTLMVAAIYVIASWQLGWSGVLSIFGLATLLAFVVEDMLLISQHTHVPMELSLGRRVLPHSAMQQGRFTRSLRFPAAVSSWLLNVDAHELHHMYPFVPGYRLREIPYDAPHEVPWWRWVQAARAIPGDVLLFQNRHQTGIDL